MLLANGNVDFVYGPGDQPIEHIQGSTVTYLHTDQQGSVRMITSSAGAVIGTYNYTAYGQVSSHTGTATSVLQYGGQFTDSGSGLIYLRARYYNPGTGQFLTVDPAVKLTESPYGYAAGNPLNKADPAGLSWWDAVATGAAVVGLGLGIAAAVVTAPATAAVLTGAAIILGGVAAGIGVAESADTCFDAGWGSGKCGDAILHANINSLFTAASARWLNLTGVSGVVEQVVDYVGGVIVDKVSGALLGLNGPRCSGW